MNDSTYIIFSKWQDYRDGKQMSALPEVRDDGSMGKGEGRYDYKESFGGDGIKQEHAYLWLWL